MQIAVSDVQLTFIDQRGQLTGRSRWSDVVGLEFTQIIEPRIFAAQAVERLQHDRRTVARLSRRRVLQLVPETAIEQILPAGRRGFQQPAVIDKGQIVVHQRRVAVVDAGDLVAALRLKFGQ